MMKAVIPVNLTIRGRNVVSGGEDLKRLFVLVFLCPIFFCIVVENNPVFIKYVLYFKFALLFYK